ncbi:uncharacterized protein LOC109607901 [Aethina tumida]|uniref:uncharacterized protein LOC109607901 n=1 Tax=Aethina tumida TaxID=116153 RepID=UPI00096B53F8|nr:uncharacterized protein LOC109607901 [Aethina tumida]
MDGSGIGDYHIRPLRALNLNLQEEEDVRPIRNRLSFYFAIIQTFLSQPDEEFLPKEEPHAFREYPLSRSPGRINIRVPDTPAFLEEISGEFEDIMLGDINPDHLIPLDDEMGDVNPFGEIFENIGHLKFFKLLFRGPSDESMYASAVNGFLDTWLTFFLGFLSFIILYKL